MYAPYPENMMESIKKVEATRAQRMATEHPVLPDR